MKHVKILGTGCPKCKRTYAVVESAVQQIGQEVRLEKVEDIMEIMQYDIISTPAVVVDEVVEIKGRIPSESEMIKLLRS